LKVTKVDGSIENKGKNWGGIGVVQFFDYNSETRFDNLKKASVSFLLTI